MILFKNDWGRYPLADVHRSTKNDSFIRLALIYRAFGVENYAFLLAIHNPELVGVDPFSPHLTPQQCGAIAIECRVNPWYYFREIAMVPGLAGAQASPLLANRGNIALFWLFFNHVFTTLIQIRQTGKSLSTDMLMNYLMNIACRDTKINLLTKDDDLRRKNIQRLKEIYAEMPVYLQQKTREDTNNLEEITVRALGNFYNAHVPQSSEKRAINMGRGLTSPIFHIDEGPFQTRISDAMPAALAATGAAADAAKKSGGHYGTILTTTAGKRDDKDGKFIYNIVEGSAIWSEAFFDCFDHTQLTETIRKAARGKVVRVNITLNHQQLGKTDEWLLEKLEEAVQSGDGANRDYFNMWTSGSQSSPLPIEITERITASCKDVSSTEIDGVQRYTTRWYKPINDIKALLDSRAFIMSLDTSEGAGKDDIALLITDPETFETVAAAHVNETNMIIFAKWVCAMMVRFPKLVTIIERRSTGGMLMDYLMVYLPQYGLDPFRRMYNTIVQNAKLNPNAYDEVRQPMNRRDEQLYVKFKQSFGFATSGGGATSRENLFSITLQLAAKRACDRIYDKKLIDQICALEMRNGRVDHPTGGHDDLVVAFLLAHWLMTQGNNLAHYGLDVTRIGINAREDAFAVDSIELQLRQEQTGVRLKIEELGERLGACKDEFLIMRLSQEMRVLSQQVVVDENEVYNIESVIQEAMEKRKEKYRDNKKPWDRGQSHSRIRDPFGSSTTYTNYGFRY